jgi:hypothetical protein
MRGNGASRYTAVLPEITWANREGFRLVLPSCFRVPFTEERAIAAVARADLPNSQARGTAPRSWSYSSTEMRREG